jgi:phage terminase small subunit
MLDNAEVRQAIEKGLEKHAAKTGITAERVIAEMAKLAFMNLKNAYAEDGSMKNIHDMDESTQAAIASMETDELMERQGREMVKIGNRKKIRTHDKTRALELLGKHFKLFNDRLELSGELKTSGMSLEDMAAIMSDPALKEDARQLALRVAKAKKGEEK